MSTVYRVGVVGAGTMGHGIAEVAAISGLEVSLTDVKKVFLDKAKEKIQWSLSRMSEKGLLKETPEAVMGRITTTVDLAKAVKPCDLVVEAVPETLELKREVFRKLDAHTRPTATLATNTSSLPIGEISGSVKNPSRVVGVHFFNPPAIMKLVEIIQGRDTSQEALDLAVQFTKKLGKRPVMVRKDVPGFIVNRVLVRMMTTARLVVASGMATMQEVDASLRYTAGLPMGAFELSDYIGLDVQYSVEKALAERGFATYSDAMLGEMVKAGHLGMKTGSGFYTYSKESPRANIPSALADKISSAMILSPAVNEAAWILANEVATRDDIDTSIVLGLGFPDGILQKADFWGIDKVVTNLNTLKAKTRQGWLEPEPLLRSMVGTGSLGAASGKGFYDYPSPG